MECKATREDGTIDHDNCAHLTTHPLKNRYICRATKCTSGERMCWACAGQRWRRFGHISRLIPSFFVAGAMGENLSVCDHETGLCVFHTDNGPEADRFPPDKWKVITPKAGPKNKVFHMKTKPSAIRKLGKRARTYVREEIPLDLLEQLELPKVDSDFDPDDDLGVDPYYEIPPIPKQPTEKIKKKPAFVVKPAIHKPPVVPATKKQVYAPRQAPPARPASSEVPAPKPRAQDSVSMRELDNLIAFLTSTPSTIGVLAQDDDE